MFEEIYECLGLDGKTAERSYDRERSFVDLSRSLEEVREHRWNWIERYESEEDRGIELLQRQRRLEEEGECVITTSPNGNGNWLEDSLPNYESTPDQQSQQLEEIREQY